MKTILILSLLTLTGIANADSAGKVVGLANARIITVYQLQNNSCQAIRKDVSPSWDSIVADLTAKLVSDGTDTTDLNFDTIDLGPQQIGGAPPECAPGVESIVVRAIIGGPQPDYSGDSIE